MFSGLFIFELPPASEFVFYFLNRPFLKIRHYRHPLKSIVRRPIDPWARAADRGGKSVLHLWNFRETPFPGLFLRAKVCRTHKGRSFYGLGTVGVRGCFIYI